MIFTPYTPYMITVLSSPGMKILASDFVYFLEEKQR